MSRTIIQIPVSSELRDSALEMAESQGFSSLQEALRVIMHKFASGKLMVGVYTEPAPVQLSARAIKRYDRMTRDIESGKNISSADSIEELMAQLGYEDKQTQKVSKKLSHKNSPKSKTSKKVRGEVGSLPFIAE